jgi:hypothetical protein
VPQLFPKKENGLKPKQALNKNLLDSKKILMKLRISKKSEKMATEVLQKIKS